MGFPDYLTVMISLNFRLFLPFTFLVVILCCKIRLDGAPVSYYMNLLICNLIHIFSLILLKSTMDPLQENLLIITYYFEMYNFGAVTSLCFRMCVAVERLFLICWPQQDFIRQTKGSVIICVSVWLFCIVLVTNVIIFKLYYLLVTVGLLSAPVFIISLVSGVTYLPNVTSFPAAERHRIMGIFVIIILNYTLAILPTLIYFIYTYLHSPELTEIIFTLFLFSPFMDLILFVFLCKDVTDQLLMCVSCCRKEKQTIC